MLAGSSYVRVIALDFSKAFDSVRVRHSTLLHKVSSLPLPDEVYNLIKDFFVHGSHCTRLCEEYSEVIDILASVIQAALRHATFVINGGDLHPVVKANDLLKYADDTYLIVSAENSSSCENELQHIKRWATVNNLHLNQSKSAEIIFPA